MYPQLINFKWNVEVVYIPIKKTQICLELKWEYLQLLTYL